MVVLPQTGVDVAAVAALLVVALGAVVAVVVGCYFAFLLVRRFWGFSIGFAITRNVRGGLIGHQVQKQVERIK